MQRQRERDRVIATLAGQGVSRRAIAKKLGLSERSLFRAVSRLRKAGILVEITSDVQETASDGV